MRDILVILIFTIIGFALGYWIHGDAANADLSLQFILFGNDANVAADAQNMEAIEETRKNILIAALGGGAIGTLITLILQRVKK